MLPQTDNERVRGIACRLMALSLPFTALALVSCESGWDLTIVNRCDVPISVTSRSDSGWPTFGKPTPAHSRDTTFVMGTPWRRSYRVMTGPLAGVRVPMTKRHGQWMTVFSGRSCRARG